MSRIATPIAAIAISFAFALGLAPDKGAFVKVALLGPAAAIAYWLGYYDTAHAIAVYITQA